MSVKTAEILGNGQAGDDYFKLSDDRVVKVTSTPKPSWEFEMVQGSTLEGEPVIIEDFEDAYKFLDSLNPVKHLLEYNQ